MKLSNLTNREKVDYVFQLCEDNQVGIKDFHIGLDYIDLIIIAKNKELIKLYIDDKGYITEVK